jgi:hypothetical protein
LGLLSKIPLSSNQAFSNPLYPSNQTDDDDSKNKHGDKEEDRSTSHS